MFRYAHTNIIAKDYRKLIDFYKDVFRCKSKGETRDLRGEWLDRLTNIHSVSWQISLASAIKQSQNGNGERICQI